MKFRDILNLIVLFVVGLFAVVKLGGVGRIIGLALIATGLVWLIITLIHSGVIRPRSKKSKKMKKKKSDVSGKKRNSKNTILTADSVTAPIAEVIP